MKKTLGNTIAAIVVLASCTECPFGGEPETIPGTTTSYDMSLMADAGLLDPQMSCNQLCYIGEELRWPNSCGFGTMSGTDICLEGAECQTDGGARGLDCTGYGLSVSIDQLYDAGLDGLDRPCEWTCLWMLEALPLPGSASYPTYSCSFSSSGLSLTCSSPSTTACEGGSL